MEVPATCVSMRRRSCRVFLIRDQTRLATDGDHAFDALFRWRSIANRLRTGAKSGQGAGVSLFTGRSGYRIAAGFDATLPKETLASSGGYPGDGDARWTVAVIIVKGSAIARSSATIGKTI